MLINFDTINNMYTTFIQKICVINSDDKLFLADDKSNISFQGVVYKITPLAVEKGQGNDVCCVGRVMRVCEVYYQKVTYHIYSDNCNQQIMTIVYTRDASKPKKRMTINYILFNNGKFYKFN